MNHCYLLSKGGKQTSNLVAFKHIFQSVLRNRSIVLGLVGLNRKGYLYSCKRSLSNVEYDFDYLCNERNTQSIKENIKKRKQVGDIDHVIELWNKLKQHKIHNHEKESIENKLYEAADLIPNQSSPHLLAQGDSPKVIKLVNDKPTFNFTPGEFHALAEKHHILKCGDGRLSLFLGPRSYYLSGTLVDIEQALIRYTLSYLLKKGFTMISVPDILYGDIIQRCGMEVDGEFSKVFRLSNGIKNEHICLSGTSEMALGGLFRNRGFNFDELPVKVVAVSRCYRKEAGELSKEKGIYRVHVFTKVEMFGITANESSTDFVKELVDIQIEMFTPLGFNFQVLDMPLSDLGAPAYSKIDIEAWIPAQNFYGEISSASNCTDFQSRRLNIRYKDKDGKERFAHTVNGTACAIPRCLMAILTSNQTEKGLITIPHPLRPYMGDLDSICPSQNPFPLVTFKGQSYNGTILNRDNCEFQRTKYSKNIL